MKTEFRISQRLRRDVLAELARPHSHASERVGFLRCGVARVHDDLLLVLAEDFLPVADEDYLEDPAVGARIGSAAIRKALQYAYNSPCSMFHVHCHEHRGRPFFSRVDVRESARFIPDFFNVRPERPHGAMVLSLDSAAGLFWPSHPDTPVAIATISFVGTPFELVGGRNE